MTPLSLILLFALSAGCVLAGRLLFHYFQLESYQHPGYFRTVRRNTLKAFLPGLIETLVLVLSLFLFGVLCPEDNDWLPHSPRFRRCDPLRHSALPGLP